MPGMRFLMLVNATQDSEARAMPEEKLIRVKASAHQELARTSMWLDASRPQDSSKGWCIEHSGKQRSFVDGPFVETKELIAGHNILDRHPGSPAGRRVSAATKKAAAMPSHRVVV
jgi:hypothetical protein